MVIVQGAGVAAALAAENDVAVQELAYEKLRERLLAQKQVLDLPQVPDVAAAPCGSIDPKSLSGIVLDDADATLTGQWARSTNFEPYIGRGYVHDERKGDGKSSATVRFRVKKPGRHNLLFAYSPHETRAKKVPVTVSSGPHHETISVDQTRGAAVGEPQPTLAGTGRGVLHPAPE